MLQKITIIALLLLSFCISYSFAYAAEVNVQLQIPVGTTKSITVCRPTGSFLSCTGIAEYISSIYRWVIGFAAVLAVLALTWGGIQWLTAGGESGKTQEAQKVIGNAIIGLLLALGSYTMLYAINPRLTQYDALKIAAIAPIDLKIDPASSTENAATDDVTTIPTDRGSEGIGFNNIPLKKQWLHIGVPYGSCGAEGTISRAGCGPTSLAMVASFYAGKDISVTETAQVLNQEGFRICGSGTVHEGIISSKVLDRYGLKGSRPDARKQSIIDLLKEKKPVIVTINANDGKCPNKFTQGGHYIVLTGTSSDGNTIYVNDPNKNNTQATSDEIFKCLTDALLVEKK